MCNTVELMEQKLISVVFLFNVLFGPVVQVFSTARAPFFKKTFFNMFNILPVHVYYNKNALKVNLSKLHHIFFLHHFGVLLSKKVILLMCSVSHFNLQSCNTKRTLYKTTEQMATFSVTEIACFIKPTEIYHSIHQFPSALQHFSIFRSQLCISSSQLLLMFSVKKL